MSKEEKEKFEQSERKKILITMIVGVCLNVISLAIILFPMYSATKNTCKGLSGCEVIWGMPFIFIPAAVTVSIYSAWISTFIFWHENEMDPNGKQTRHVPEKLIRSITVVNGVLSLAFLGLSMLVLSNQV